MCKVKAGVFPGLQACRDAVVNEGIHRTRFFDRNNRIDVKVFNLARDVRIKGTGVKLRDAPDTRSTVYDIVPGRGNIIAHWAHDAKTCNDDTSFHGSLLICDKGGQGLRRNPTVIKTHVALAPDARTA